MILPVRNVERLVNAELARSRVLLKTMRRRALVLVFAVVFASIGVTMLFVAIFTVLSEIYGPATAALLVAGIAFAILLVLVLVGMLAGRQERRQADEAARRAREEALRDIEAVSDLIQGLGHLAGGTPSFRPTGLALLAMGIGLLAGLTSRRRR